MAKVNKRIDTANEVFEPFLSALVMESPTSNFFKPKLINKIIMRVILIDSNNNLFNILQGIFLKAGIEIKRVSTIESVVSLLKTGEIDCVLYHPDINSNPDFSFISKVAAINFSGGIIILSENKTIKEQLRALDAGADAYHELPIVAGEVVARIRSLSKLRKTPSHNLIQFNELKLDKQERRFYVNDVLVFLTQTEFEILLYLIENKNKIVTRQDLISNSWKEKTNYEKYTVALYSHIKNVKKKIEENNVEDYIETIYGVGYIIREKPTS